MKVRMPKRKIFLLTRPSRGATAGSSPQNTWHQTISTHTPLAGRDWFIREPPHTPIISTHTPLAGRDNVLGRNPKSIQISTHTPLAGRDHYVQGCIYRQGYFYSHAPRGARQLAWSDLWNRYAISTHTPLAGRDHRGNNQSADDYDFYSHAPRGARPLSR